MSAGHATIAAGARPEDAAGYVDELKVLIRLHILTQDVNHEVFYRVLDGIETDDDGPGGWVARWEDEGDRQRAAGRLIDAMQCYNFARFPVIDSLARSRAHDKCLAAWRAWAQASKAPVETTAVAFQGALVPIHISTAAGPDRPWVLVMGGIVSLKEQWYRTLADGAKLGFRVAVADFPGVGENALAYRADSHRFLSALIDHLHQRGQAAPVYTLGISFGGHLAVRCALEDARVAGVIASGSPLQRFFTDRAWQDRVPETTRRTLAHLCRVQSAALWPLLEGFAVHAAELRGLRVPLCYIASRRDEIVPFDETALIRAEVPHGRVVIFDDVHGSPHHIREIRKLIPLTLLRMDGRAPVLRAALWLLLQIARVRSRLEARAVPALALPAPETPPAKEPRP
jgi:esterase FrsA